MKVYSPTNEQYLCAGVHWGMTTVLNVSVPRCYLLNPVVILMTKLEDDSNIALYLWNRLLLHLLPLLQTGEGDNFVNKN